MNKQIERILICLLWLLAATLGASFWLNTMFGFNLFSAQHWQYLAYMQASQTPVRGAFYISLIFAILITVGVLYILIKPHGIFRRRVGISNARRATTQSMTQPTARTNTHSAPSPTPSDIAQPSTPPQAPKMTRPMGPVAMPRSISVNAPQGVSPTPTAQPQPSAPTFTPTFSTGPTPAPGSANIDFDTIRKIFSDTGYTVKHSPQIGNFRPALLAIGLDEMLWIGGVGITQETLRAAMDRLASIFADTLDDIEINITGFIIAPTATVSDSTILAFATTDELREYMDAHRNPEMSDNDSRENFNAYSEYIDTVINYMDKT